MKLLRWVGLEYPPYPVFDEHKNLAYSLVATAPSPATTGTSVVVTTNQGSRFPVAPFDATIWPAGETPTPANSEIVRVTDVSTDTLTIERAQTGTTARSVVVGDQIAATITTRTVEDLEHIVYELTRVVRRLLGET